MIITGSRISANSLPWQGSRKFSKGTAQFEGKGSWSLQDFSTQGTVQAKDIEWSNGKVSMRNGRITAGFSVTPDRFHLSSIKANMLGGDLLGDADVTNWQSSLNRRRPQGGAM